MDENYTTKDWLAFIQAADVTLLPTETIDDMTAAAVSRDWTGGPVEALVPEVVPEFQAITERLCAAADPADDSRRARLYQTTTPALFRIGCAFGEMMETLQEARENEDAGAERLAHDQLRGIWACIGAFADDYQ